jgi:hypothetical protein
VAPPIAAGSGSSGSRTWLFVAAGGVLSVFGGGLCCLGGVIGLGLMDDGGSETASLANGPITWNGELTASDRMEGSRYYDTFAFEALPGQAFTVELSSSAFDPILRLDTPSGSSMENDDWGLSLNSRIDVTSAESGRYTVRVTTFDSAASGAYLVLVHP